MTNVQMTKWLDIKKLDIRHFVIRRSLDISHSSLDIFKNMKIKIQKLHPEATTPSYAHEGDAGMDLFTIENYTIQPQERHVFKTGVAMEIPDGYVGLIWDKSGLSAKHGLHHFAGVIDSIYRGEIQVVIYNSSDQEYEFKQGDKIAQILIQKVDQVELEETSELSSTSREDKGWGSSGK